MPLDTTKRLTELNSKLDQVVAATGKPPIVPVSKLKAPGGLGTELLAKRLAARGLRLK